MFTDKTQFRVRRIARAIIAIPIAAGAIEFLARTLFLYTVIVHGVLFEAEPAPSAGEMFGYALHSFLYPLVEPLALAFGGEFQPPLLVDLLDNWWVPEWQIAMLVAWYVFSAAVVLFGWRTLR